VIAALFGPELALMNLPVAETHLPRELLDPLGHETQELRVTVRRSKLLFPGAEQHQFLPLFVKLRGAGIESQRRLYT